jgi:hypothetical protein
MNSSSPRFSLSLKGSSSGRKMVPEVMAAIGDVVRKMLTAGNSGAGLAKSCHHSHFRGVRRGRA